MRNIYFILAAIAIGCSFSYGQITPPSAVLDSIETEDIIIEKDESNDNVEVKEIETYNDRFIPRKASLYSAALPGAGQIYNRNAWKVPIIYGGFVALGYTIDFYNDRYQLLRGQLFKTISDPDYVSPFGSEEQLRSRVNRERRDRDFYTIMIGLLYLLQVAEAHIDAHLKEFKVNPDLQVSIEPSIDNSIYAGYNAGISLKFKF